MLLLVYLEVPHACLRRCHVHVTDCRVRSCEMLLCPGCSSRASWMLPGTAALMPVSPRVLGIQHACQRHQQLMRPSDLCDAPPCRAAVCLLHACRWAEGSLPARLNHVPPSTFSLAFKLVHVRPFSSTCEACTSTCRTTELTVSLHCLPPATTLQSAACSWTRAARPSPATTAPPWRRGCWRYAATGTTRPDGTAPA